MPVGDMPPSRNRGLYSAQRNKRQHISTLPHSDVEYDMEGRRSLDNPAVDSDALFGWKWT